MAKPVIQQQRTAKQYIGLSDTAQRVSEGMRFVTFVKSNAKALLTLRIKSPLRSAEGISRCRASRYVFLRPHGTAEHGVLQALCNTLLCGQYPHSLGYFPMQRALNFSLLPPPRPPFSRRRLCICGGSYYIPDDTAAVFFGW